MTETLRSASAKGAAGVPTGPSAATKPAPKLNIGASEGLAAWLAERRVSLAFTTYRRGMLFMIGLQPDGRLSILQRSLDHCMGLATSGSGLIVGTRHQIWRFEDALQPGQDSGGYDRVYVPQVGYVTGDLEIHDVAVDRTGRVVFVNTLFGCLATSSEFHSFSPIWRPPFLSALAPEDRCHLSGLAMRDGLPAFATAAAETDSKEGWRDRLGDGGCLIGIDDDEVILRGLSLPQSPRWHDDRLWLHNSGAGQFGQVDLNNGAFEPVCFGPGFLRGLDFTGDFAVMGLSKPRDGGGFAGLALEDGLSRHKVKPHCGLQVVDLRSGKAVHALVIEGLVSEIYDVVLLPQTVRPMAIGFQGNHIRRVITVGD